MTHRTLLFIAALMLPSAASAYDQLDPDASIGTIYGYRAEAQVRVTKWQKDPQRTCSDDIIRVAWGEINAAVAVVTNASTQLGKPEWGRVGRWAFTETLTRGAPIAAQAQLDFAAAYLVGGCPVAAKQVYQDVLGTFTGANYQAYREQAMMGLADIRAKQ